MVKIGPKTSYVEFRKTERSTHHRTIPPKKISLPGQEEKLSIREKSFGLRTLLTTQILWYHKVTIALIILK